MKKYKHWDLFEVLPKGWKIDIHCGSPLHGYDFCNNGISVINGGKRALVKSIRKGEARMQFVEKKEKINQKIEKKDDFIFPSKTVNILARKKFQEHLLKEIMFDLMVCELEGWDKKEYLNEIKKLLNSINTVNAKNVKVNNIPNLFSSNDN